MNIEVTRDNVTILEQSETPHENEYKITTCYFTFDEFTSSFQVKRAIFTILSTEEMYETDIINNQCDIPSEVLKHEYETVKLGVYGYNIGDNDELLNRFSPSYAEIVVPTGSYKEGALSPEPITPSQYDLYSQALQEGLQEVDDKLDEVVETVDGKIEEVDSKITEVDGKIDEVDDKITEVNTAITETNNLNLDVSDKVDGDVTVTLTKKDASTKSVVISDGTSLQFMWQGTSLGIKTDDMQEYVFVDLQGIKGETGATPNIQIGTVTSGSTPSVTRTGTNENPVLNFVLQPGEKGNTGDTGNGIASITKTSTTGLVDTYTITYTSGNTTTFNVENGNGIDHISLTSQSGATKVYTIYYTDGTTSEYTVQDGEVTQEVFDEEVERLKMVYNAMPKVSGEGTDLTLNNTAECPVYDVELSPSELEQETTLGTNLFDGANPTELGSTTTTFTNNIVKVSSTITNTLPQARWEFTNLQANDVIRYSAIIQNSNGQIVMQVDVNGTWTTVSSMTSVYTDGTSVVTKTFTNTNAYSKARLLLYSSNTIPTGASESSYENVIVTINNSDMSYEPYTNGASPNPQYPQEIHTVSGENSVKIQNKNLLNRETCEENKALSWSNGTIFNDTNGLASDYIKVSANEEYALNYRSQFMFYDKDKTYLGCIQSGGTTIAKATGIYDNKVTIPNIEEIYYMRLGFRATSNNNTNMTTVNIMLNKGTTLLDYVPHQEQSLPLSLGDLEYCKIGDYEDVFFKNVVGSDYYDSTLELDKWYLKKNVGKIVLDGSESWVIFNSSSSRVTFRTIINDIEGYTNGNTIPNIISNRFIPNSYNVTWVIGNVSRTTASGGQNFVLFVYEPNTTVEQFKAWLSSNNTIVYYVLATPTYTLLSDTLQTQLDNIQKAISYQEQTNVSQENADLPFVIKLSAIRDLSGIFELIQ